MYPRRGPNLFVVPGLQNVSVPAGGSVVTAGEGFRWPRALFCTGVLVVPQSGSLADAALLRLRITDEVQEEIISDGIGTTLDAAALAMHGGVGDSLGFGRPLFRPFPLQRPVLDGDCWMIRVRNVNGAPVVLAGVHLYFDEGLYNRGRDA